MSCETTWIDTEFGSIDLGDRRLNRRCQLLAQTLSMHSQSSIPVACQSWGEIKAAYRFFGNDSVTLESIIAPHQVASTERIAREDVVIIAQDTTELEFTHRRVASHLGTLSWDTRFGWLMHLSLALTMDRVSLGIVDAKIWTRDRNDPGKACRRKKTPIEDKESFRWLEGYRRACAIADITHGTRVVSVADQEGDIYEFFVEAAGGSADWVVRTSKERTMPERIPGTKSCHKRVWDHVAETDGISKMTFELPTRGDRPARTVQQTVRAAAVTLRSPCRTGKRLPEVSVNAILLLEEDPPEGIEPLEWLLITSLPIDSSDDIEFAIDCYMCRWQLECLFKVLKSGCRVERIQMETPGRVLACLGLYLVIAWRILYLTMLGRACPDLPCTVVFGDSEWKAVTVIETRRPAPDTPPTLSEMIKCIARQGSYVGRKGDGDPGMVSIWTGLQRVMDYARAWETFGPGSRSYG